MSYSFDWDCTLPISNIEDIVSLNIVPQTESFDEGDYLSLRGDILIDGEYTTTRGEQKTFTEKMPLDITLPNNGNADHVNTELTNFDFDVLPDEGLALKLNLNFEGYDFEEAVGTQETKATEVVAQPEEVVVSDVVSSVVNQDVAVVSNEEEVSVDDVVSDSLLEEIEVLEDNLMDDIDYIDFDEVVLDHKEEAIDPSLAEERKEALTSKIKDLVTKPKAKEVEEVIASEVKEPAHETDKGEEVVQEVVVEEVEQPVEEVVEAEIVEEVVVKEEKVKPVAPIPTVTKKEEVVEAEVVEDDEEILPFPLKSQKVVEEEPVETDKSEIFDLLYSLDEEETEETVVEDVEDKVETVEEIVAEEVVSQEEVKEVAEDVEEVEAKSSISSYTDGDSIANQFADGASILKVIFVQEEETTITNICNKYDVPEKAICNLDQLNSPLRCGDRVMINYGKLR